MRTTYDEYRKSKFDFFSKHKHNFNATTSDMVNDSYNKVFNFADGAQWFEYYGVAYTNEGKMFKVEYFNTDDAESRAYYERY